MCWVTTLLKPALPRDSLRPRAPYERALPKHKPLAQLGGIVIFQFIPWDQFGQIDPAVVTTEVAAKR